MSKKSKIIICTCALVLVAIVGTVVLNYTRRYGGAESPGRSAVSIVSPTPSASPTAEPTPTPVPTITVHIKGEVVNPGLYELEEGARLNDAVIAAGGLTENAGEDALNLALRLYDEDEINIPSASEVSKSRSAVVENPKVSRSANHSNSSGASSSKSNAKAAPSATHKLNINTATADELDMLPGIGPAYAQAIIEYRNTYGPFGAIEEIKKVSGIGEKRFADMKDVICVN